MRTKFRIQRRSGTAIAEAPVAIWFAILALFFPLLCLATITLRYAFMVTAAHEAAYQAAVSKTFSTDVSSTDLCAINSADATAKKVAGSFSGITVTNVTTRILQSDTTSNALQVHNQALNTPADTTRYVYLLETTIDGQVQPLILGHSAIFQDIPGLTGPMTVQVSSRKLAENPQGLNL
ncbi:MAG: hypothetical protein K2X77_20020 [Candidatus Obscuribacterales bacterium]|nr:hypothetical protein [Candidatus Obscuribacterales bacterium]